MGGDRRSEHGVSVRIRRAFPLDSWSRRTLGDPTTAAVVDGIDDNPLWSTNCMVLYICLIFRGKSGNRVKEYLGPKDLKDE
jgi:hypothetical protein